jgi:hypothetical protein
MKIQHLYMPMVHSLRDKDDSATSAPQPETSAHLIKLYLPSSISEADSPCDRRLFTIEYQLRHGQAHEALDELRTSLCLRSFAYQDKDRFSRGQRKSTRSLGLISRLERRVKTLEAKYNTAQKAIHTLANRLGKTLQEHEFPLLRPQDVRGLKDNTAPEHMKSSSSQSKKITPTQSKVSVDRGNISWIWKELGERESQHGEQMLQDGTCR